MKVLDLFCGLKGWSKAFEERGHEVVTVDIEKKFNPTIVADIKYLTVGDFEKYGRFDIILASPPCNHFSVASVYRHWKNGQPKSDEVKKSIQLVSDTFILIHQLNPKFWILENPRGMLRKIFPPETTITQCQYGRGVMKPTDLWGRLPNSFIPKSCKNRDTCHQSSPRSSKYGTQGININQDSFKKNKFAYLIRGGGGNAMFRAEIPYGLSLAVCEAVERDLK